MLSRVGRGLFALHQTSSSGIAWVNSSSNSNVSGALLHDDAEDDSLFNAKFGGCLDGIPDVSDVVVGVSCLEHLGLVIIEDGSKVRPGTHGGERRGWSGVRSETHFEFCAVWCFERCESSCCWKVVLNRAGM